MRVPARIRHLPVASALTLPTLRAGPFPLPGREREDTGDHRCRHPPIPCRPAAPDSRRPRIRRPTRQT
ncbi:hypothetical protein DS843_00015 [Roseomonas genomospecies 6]|uniref:Uncharacterized protein n=1 Tax=Roseomonas genomospecies 6 TaxID=214106 RepID=A0A9W7NNG2_9PROT|nr:hypothetical protein DS843_00015 [Roseomonas genomospecies 6]